MLNLDEIIAMYRGVQVTVVTTNSAESTAIGEVLDGVCSNNTSLRLKLTFDYNGYVAGQIITIAGNQIVSVG